MMKSGGFCSDCLRFLEAITLSLNNTGKNLPWCYSKLLLERERCIANICNTPFYKQIFNWYYSWFFSNPELHAAIQFEKPGLIFHSVGNERYNVQDSHWITGPGLHELLTYQGQTDGGNFDTEFAYQPPSLIRIV